MTFEISWPDVQLLFDGGTTPVIGVVAVAYTVNREQINLHGKGADPVGMAKGVKNYDGQFTFLQSAIEALQAVIPPGRDITDMTYNLTVAYAPEGGTPVIDRLEGVRFTSVPKNIGTTNPAMEIAMPCVIGKIKFNV